MDYIYFDNASTTQLDKRVFDKMTPYFCDVYANASSTHTCGDMAYQAIEEARDTISRILNCRHSEIYFTAGGTESNNMALRGVMHNYDRGHLIVSSIEHDSVYNTALALEKEGYEVSFAPVNVDGHVDLSRLEDLIRPDTKLISIMLVNNETGCVQPIDQIVSLAKTRGILVHTDSVQAVGHMPIDLEKMGVDMMSMSAHKFGGPKGVGALFVSNNVKLSSYMTGGDQESGYRSGTYNTPAIVGMAQALNYSQEEDYYMPLVDMLSSALIEKLTKIDGVHINGTAPRQSGIVNIYVKGVPNKLMVQLLDLKGIAISIGSACSAGMDDPSRTLVAMGKSDEEVNSSVRISLYKYNTLDEVDKLYQLLSDIISNYRSKVAFRTIDTTANI